MPVTNTQDEWNGRRIDVRHINPSIMEGERGHTSMFGQGSAVAIFRYAPFFLVQPSISGSFKIPSILTCNPGVISASPQALLYFQWQANGIDIPGETNRKITTSLAFDSYELTCEVTAVNFLGVAVGESNGITAELIEPIVNEEFMHYAVTGLNQEMQQNIFDNDVLITTGISMSQRVDVQQQIILIPTGMWVALRSDTMSCTGAVITGLNGDNQGQLFDQDVYTIWIPTPQPDLPLINGSAEVGDMTGWTVTAGTIVATNIAQQGTTLPRVTDKWYFSSHLSLKVTASMNQVVDFDSGDFTDIDAGIVMAQFSALMETYTDNFNHTLGINMEFLDDADVVTGIVSNSYRPEQSMDWQGNYCDLTYVPPLSRKVRLTLNFITSPSHDSKVYADEIRIEVFKDLP